MPPSHKSLSLGKISLLYVLLSGLWVQFSEQVLYYFIRDHEMFLRFSVLKGWFWVLATTLFFYLLMRRSGQAILAGEQLHQQFDAIKRQEEFYQRIYDSVAEGVILQHISGMFLNSNSAACALLGTSWSDMQKNEFLTQVTPWMDDQGAPFSWKTHAYNVLIKAQDSEEIRYTLKRFDPEQRWLYLNSVLLRNAQGEPSWVVTTLSDISMQKYSELQETVLYGITQRILAEHPLNVIFQYLCDELVHSVGYPVAAVVLKKSEGSVAIVAQAGVREEYVRTLKIRWDDSPEGQGAVGEAIRSGKPQVQNLINNSQFKPWWAIYEALNLQSIATFPLWAHGQCLGAIALYTHLPDYFNSVRIERLQSLAEQITMAFLSHEDRSQLQIQRTALSAAADAIVLADRTGNLLWTNPAFARLTGYAFEEVEGQNIRFLQSGYQDSSFYKIMWDTVLAGETWRGELINRHAKGTLYREEMTLTPVQADGAEITHFIAIKQDVSERFATQKALRDSEERYEEMFENMSNAVAVFQFSEDEKIFHCKAFNRAAEQMENLPRSQVLGQPLDRFFSNHESLGILKIFFHVFRTGEASHFPATYYHNAYVSGWREGFIYKLSTREVVAIYEDVTRRKQDEETLWLEKERAQITLASIGDGVITTDVQAKITYLNPVAERLTGWTNRQAEGLPLLSVFNIRNENTGQAVINPVTQCLREKSIVTLANHTALTHRDGHTISIEDSAAPICDRAGDLIGAVLVFHDVSDKRALVLQLSHQAHHDALTGLPNRILYKDRAHQAIVQAHRHQTYVAVLFLDLDRFKLVNDTLGHTMGDQLLRATGERIVACLREGDTVSRQGGDEFLVLLPEMRSEAQAAQVAQKIMDVFKAPFHLHEQEIYITVSLGIAIFPTDGEDIETLIKYADTAMYHAKDEGRNHYQFYSLAFNQALSVRLGLQNEMRRALAYEEFVLYYQPQYRISDGQMCGMEALVRWQHPERGFLLPGEFISIAEENGLILPLGEWVLRSACLQNKRWQEMGYPPVRVAVNLSARQFRQANLVSQIAQILTETGLDPQWLELEITESISMENSSFTLAILQELKGMGIRLSLDDFGTGFSSLSYLSRFSLDTLKIDRSFVSALTTRSDERKHGNEIVTTIIKLAHNLGLRVIAEGVETEAQLDFLRSQGCAEVQGYLLARPVSAEDLVFYLIEISLNLKKKLRFSG
ncbi:diguanylate cyclase/phosphodiesterase (GGDEF & EAL domains) with PAS/PAC sensor(s) [Desulfosporosinus metallidurans]|uniref:Diguanylate cyclase/phosphodiesterase (GGDEF & EAL domains) with PAS/PAC sensor(S) n=2 Tax=Desulfosporosinus metallidurans TaxID=1888891 RepID=A0A1Q8QN92_9FIRM|nr:diguanylate cyclase/phosphodiesterase (GGDEF & EAL domains) with PAS/PAC sensor(s) [Desulfosporosinus metallidurans]